MYWHLFLRSPPPPEAAASKIVENCHKNRQKSSKIVKNRQKSLDAFCRCRFWEKKDWVLATVNLFCRKSSQKSSKIVENSYKNHRKSSKIVENLQISSKNCQKSSDDFCNFRCCRFWGGTFFRFFRQFMSLVNRILTNLLSTNLYCQHSRNWCNF